MANTLTANLNISIPAPGDVNWDNEYADMVEAVDDIGNLLCLAINSTGNAIDEQIIFEGFQPQEDITVMAVSIFAMVAPVDADLQIDVLKDGVELVDMATLTDAATFQKTTLAAPQDILKTERLGLKIKQIGSGTAGADLFVNIYYKKKSIPASS